MKIIILIIFLSIGCSSSIPKPSKLANNTTFSKDETTQLLSFLDAFDQSVCKLEGIDNNKLSECYASFFTRLKNQERSGKIIVGIHKTRHEALIAILDKKLKKELWSSTYQYGINENGEKDTIENKVLNVRGKYFKHLSDEVSLDHPAIKRNIIRIIKVGDLSPSLFADLLLNYNDFNIEDDRVRLLFAIHYWGLNGNYLE